MKCQKKIYSIVSLIIYSRKVEIGLQHKLYLQYLLIASFITMWKETTCFVYIGCLRFLVYVRVF